MKKLLFAVIIFGWFFSYYAHAKYDTLFKVNTRVLLKGTATSSLNRSDFKLYINENIVEIKDFISSSRSIKPNRAKINFVLDFKLTDFSNNIKNVVIDFVENVLKNCDVLIIVSPLKCYRMNTSLEKDKIIEDINKIIKKDSLNYKKNIISSRDNLLRLIRKLETGTSQNKGEASLTITGINSFLANYTREWTSFKTNFLLPNPKKYESIANLLYSEGEEIWYISFQQREIMPALTRYKKVQRSISNYLSALSGEELAMASSVHSNLKNLDLAMLISDQFPKEQITNMLLGANINYNVLFFKSYTAARVDKDGTSPDLENLMKQIALSSGGMSVISNNLVDGLKQILAHQDHFYSLVFKLDDKIEEKLLKIECLKPGVTVHYKNKFTLDEIKAFHKFANEKKVEISDLFTKNYLLKFRVNNLAIDKKKGVTGMVKIILELYDDKNNQVFHTGKTLTANKDHINLSLKLPAKYKGYFKLKITAIDLINKRKAVSDKYVKLK